MTRRRSDGSSGARAVTKAHTRTAVKVASQDVKAGGRLKVEVVLPVGIGAVGVCGGSNGWGTRGGHRGERLRAAGAPEGPPGLGTHRHFHEQLRVQIQEARENGTPLAVVALDIDGFKKLNDDRGHGHGDESLK